MIQLFHSFYFFTEIAYLSSSISKNQRVIQSN
uniref:Uncharacterized protein n=1 Tax=Arundo donax TaxID=35708 RepID=A0A0A9C3N7_ARUDO